DLRIVAGKIQKVFVLGIFRIQDSELAVEWTAAALGQSQIRLGKLYRPRPPEPRSLIFGGPSDLAILNGLLEAQSPGLVQVKRQLYESVGGIGAGDLDRGRRCVPATRPCLAGHFVVLERQLELMIVFQLIAAAHHVDGAGIGLRRQAEGVSEHERSSPRPPHVRYPPPHAISLMSEDGTFLACDASIA